MRSFLRNNLLIVISVALPFLTVLFFALASILPGLYSTPSAHDLLLSFQDRATSKAAQVRISKNGAVVRVRLPTIALSTIAIRTNKRYISNSNPINTNMKDDHE